VRITPPGGLEVDRIEFIDTPGVSEQYPPVIVNSDAEVAAAVAQGYVAPVWNEAAAKAAYNPPQVPENYSVSQYPKYIAAHDKVVSSFAEERAAREAERAKRMPTLAECGGDADKYGQALAAWLLAQAKPAAPAYTPAQARAAADVSESRVTALIAGGWLAEVDKCIPDSIIKAMAARDAADTQP
jgi:hypothetical protein